MRFKYKEVKKKIMTSFLTFSLLLSSPIGLTANESEVNDKDKKIKTNEVQIDDNFKIEFPSSHKKLQKINLTFNDYEGFVARYYAHNFSYVICKDFILYGKLNEESRYILDFKDEPKVIAHDFLNFERENKKYALIFVLLENSKIQYYLFDGNINNVTVGKLRNDFFKVSKDVKIEVDFDVTTKEYVLKISAPGFVLSKHVYGEVFFEWG